MGALHKRIAALEGVAGNDCWGPILDQLPIADLDRLETIIGGMAITPEGVGNMADADAEFLARVVAMKG